jgi:uncharacterized phage protein (predicted DNA packaging)
MALFDAVKKHCNVDEEITDHDTLIQESIDSAIILINGQTGKTQVKTGVDDAGLPVYGPISADGLWIQCVKMLVAHWYMNRGVETAGTTSRTSFSVDAIINHIAMCGDYV